MPADFASASKTEDGPQYHHQVIDLLQEEQPDGTMRLRVTSGSMRPVLRPGDHLIVKPAPADSLKTGDIVVLRDAHGLLTHRLLRKQGSDVFTKGDASHWSDPPAPVGCVFGRALAVERNGRLYRDFTQARQEGLSTWLARLSSWEGRLYARLGRPDAPLNTLQKCIARAITLPLRAIAFLLQ